MSNLSPEDTGLPLVVWISPKGSARHDVRVKVSRGPTAKPGEFITVAIRPHVRVVGAPKGKLTANELTKLTQWIELNRQVLVDFWDGRIAYTKEVLNKLQAI